MSGQPDIAGWNFDMQKVEAIEAGLNPGFIVNAPNTLTLRSTLTNVGFASGALIAAPGTPGVIEYFATQLDAAVPTTKTLASTPFVMNASSVTQDSAPISTGAAGTLGVGTWHITALVSFPTTIFSALVAGFNEIVVRVI